MRELRSRSKKLNGKHTEKTGAELPHNNTYFTTLMVSYLGGIRNEQSAAADSLFSAVADSLLTLLHECERYTFPSSTF